VAIAVTESADAIRVQLPDGQADIALAVTAIGKFVTNAQAVPSFAMSASSGVNATFGYAGTASGAFTASMTGAIMGEDWSDAAIGNEEWVNIGIGSEIWSNVSVGSEVWLVQ
jgi:hypothetical protein